MNAIQQFVAESRGGSRNRIMIVDLTAKKKQTIYDKRFKRVKFGYSARVTVYRAIRSSFPLIQLMTARFRVYWPLPGVHVRSRGY